MFTPLATNPVMPEGLLSQMIRVADSVGKRPNMQAPVPVNLAGPNCVSHSMLSLTSGYSLLTTSSQSFRYLEASPSKAGAILILGVSLVKPCAENIFPVWTSQPGFRTKNQSSGGCAGVSFSPTPSPKAACPCTKTGTSAPSVRPVSASSSSPNPSFHRWFSPSKVVAALELPPPSPPPMGRRFSMLMFTPGSSPDAFFARAWAALRIRLSSSGTPAMGLSSLTPGCPGVRVSVMSSP